MDAPGFASPIRVYRQNLSQMRKSNDPNGSEKTNLCSLGVVDLDLAVCPDVFGLRAFDEKLPITRMLPGATPCDLRLPIPQAVFQVMRERCVEMEDLRRKAYTGDQPAYHYTGRGYCPVCEIKTEHSLDSHMMCHHLGLGQLWRCPVEWCAVWKGSVRECRDHFNEKHSGSETLDFDKVSKSFPVWTVTRDFWEQALKPEISGIAVDIRLFHESGRRLVHKYRVYQDPLPHPALREGRITRLISLVNRAMVIAKLTQLRIAIPSS